MSGFVGIRNLAGKVLRVYQNNAGTWSVDRDYVYRYDKLLGSVTPWGIVHYHLDHLGTPRMITNAAKRRVAYHAYYPNGVEATSPTQNDERIKFTGHERDLNRTTGANPTADDLDYMHARFYNPQPGRFLSVDPGRDFEPAAPQSWNLYAYTRNNPMRFVDPDGRTSADTMRAFASAGVTAFAGVAAYFGAPIGLGVVAMLVAVDTLEATNLLARDNGHESIVHYFVAPELSVIDQQQTDVMRRNERIRPHLRSLESRRYDMRSWARIYNRIYKDPESAALFTQEAVELTTRIEQIQKLLSEGKTKEAPDRHESPCSVITCAKGR